LWGKPDHRHCTYSGSGSSSLAVKAETRFLGKLERLKMKEVDEMIVGCNMHLFKLCAREDDRSIRWRWHNLAIIWQILLRDGRVRLGYDQLLALLD
jgi:hypothetical protein